MLSACGTASLLAGRAWPVLGATAVATRGLCKDKFSLPEGFDGRQSVWLEYSALAMEHQPLNLGQGFPDYTPLPYIVQELADVALENSLHNQYTRGVGHPRLVNAISKTFAKFICRELDPKSEIIVTVGAFEALFCALIGHTKPGDEVIIIEPFFECYAPIVRQARGVPRFVPLRPLKTCSGELTSADWVLDEQELRAAFNPKTKAIVVNSPHNPTGKVFTPCEMRLIAELCQQWDALCLSDEAYEWIVYDDRRNVRMCTLPGMWERTVTVGTAGKTFSVTGWKTGWAYGPAPLIKNLMVVHQNCAGQTPTITQEAVARGFERELRRLDKPDCYFWSIARDMRGKRDFAVAFLREAGLKPVVPEGGYFVMADWSGLADKVDLSAEKDQLLDYRFTKWLTKNVKLMGIPPSAFYGEQNKKLGENYVRFCFFKKDETLKKAADILQAWKSKL